MKLMKKGHGRRRPRYQTQPHTVPGECSGCGEPMRVAGPGIHLCRSCLELTEAAPNLMYAEIVGELAVA